MRDDELKYFKQTVRWAGAYSLITIGLLMLVGVLAPNGPAPTWHVMLTLFAGVVLMLPYALLSVFWINTEITRWRKFGKKEEINA